MDSFCQPTKNHKIAVIGAGLAGLTVAYRLFQKGYSVNLYEARAYLDNSVPHIPDDIQFKRYASPLIKAWSRDPFAKASYSAYGTLLNEKIDQKIQYRGITFKKIFAPIEDRIFFVGEHATLLDEVGTMEAAVESGERLAKLF
jgi:monoamine oxidase